MNFLNPLFADFVVDEILVLVILVVPYGFDFVGFVGVGVGGSGFVVGFVVLVGFVVCL